MQPLERAKQWTERNAVRIVLIASAAAFALFAGTSLLRYFTAAASGLDLGIYGQVLWNTAHGRWFEFSIHPHSYLGDHLEFGLVLLTPFAKAFGAIPVLLVGQSLVLASGGPFAFALARRHLPLWIAVLVAVLFLTSPFLANAALFEFHFLTFALPVLLGAILAYEARRRVLFLTLLGATFFIREDLAPVVAAFGLLAAWDRRGWRWWLPPAVGGVAWFLISLRVVAAVSGYPESKFLTYYRWLGDSPGAVALNFFRKPLTVVQHVASLSNLGFAVGSFGAFALLPLGAVGRLIPTIPLFAQYLLGNASSVTLDVHYLVPFLPFLLWASVHAAKRLLVPTARGWFGKLAREPGLAAAGIVATALYSAAFLGPFPRVIADLTRVFRDPRTTVRVGLARHLPPSTPLAADFSFIAPAAERTRLASLHYQYRGRRQLSTIPYTIPPDITSAAWDFENVLAYQSLYRDAVKDGTDTGAERLTDFWTKRRQRILAMLDTFAVTEQSDQPSPLPYTENPPPPLRRLDAALADGLRLEGSGPSLALEEAVWFGRPVTVLPLSVTLAADRDPERTVNLLITAQKSGRVVLRRILPVAYGFHPTVNWKAGDRVRTDFRLAVNPDLTGSMLTLQLVRGDVPLVLDHLRSLRLTVPEKYRLGPAVDLGRVESAP